MVIASSFIAATIEKMEVEVSSAAENNLVVKERGVLAVGGQIPDAKKETNGGRAKNNKGNAKQSNEMQLREMWSLIHTLFLEKIGGKRTEESMSSRWRIPSQSFSLWRDTLAQVSSNLQSGENLAYQVSRASKHQLFMVPKFSVNLISAFGISKVNLVMKELPAKCFCGGGEGYDWVGWIEKQNERSVEQKREAKGKVTRAKDKERDLQAKLQEHMAKRTTADNSDDVPISESDSIASVLRSEAAQAHTEELEAIMAMLPESNEICEAVRIEPYVVDAEGHAFWKPKSDFGEDILLQDMRTWDGAPSVENWFFVALK